jgi:hypothetical protein
VSAHKRHCANCRKPGGRVTARIWFPPLRLDQSRPGPEWSVCCFNPVGCGCLVRKLGDDGRVTGDQVVTADRLTPLMPGGESTSAQLRHAEQELDVVRGSLTELTELYESATAETARVTAERDKAANTVGWLQAQNTVLLESRDLLRAELEQLRAAHRPDRTEGETT